MNAVEMKDSGVEWLGEIPAHWQLLQLSALAEINAGQSPPSSTYNDEGLGLPFFQGKAEFGERYPIAVNWCSEPQSTSQPGDILVSVRAPVGDVNITPFECCIGRGLAAIKVNGHSLNLFIYNVLIHARQYLAAQGTGSTFESINKTTLRTIPIPLPPLAEQHTIAAYLDRETARIDALIAKTQQLNALLSEKRVALISHAVTKGLDPAAPLKDSGVEWLGEIPAHWDRTKLSQLGHLSRGRSRHRPRNDPSLYDGDYPFIQTGNVAAANMYLSDYAQTYNEFGLAQSKLWQAGTLLITIAANIAETAILSIAACIPDSIVGFISSPHKADVRFVKYYVDVAKHSMEQVSRGTAQGNLSVSKLLTFDVFAPPLTEQRAIASYLDRETAKIDALIAKNDQLIALLRKNGRR